MFEPKTIGKAAADEKIKKQPYFELPDFMPLYCYQQKAMLAAAGEIGRIESVRFIKINWRDRIKGQPFYGEHQPDTIKFRRPCVAVDEVINDAMVHGHGIMRVEPGEYWNKDEPDFWWGNGKAWPSEAEFKKQYMQQPVIKLKPEYQKLADEFQICVDGGGSCTCHISPPCSYCTHPGNPANLHEDDEAWEG